MPEVVIVNEPDYNFVLKDNVRSYVHQINLAPPYRHSSAHGVLVDGEPIAVFGASGGASIVHAFSWLTLNDCVFLAVGDHIVCFTPSPFSLLWAKKLDLATCIGIHYSPARHALIVHGELDISRIDENGEVLWSSSGNDIFTGKLTFSASSVDIADFNDRAYRFDYETGKEL